ncbi:MAG: ATP-dependent DNA helicase RecG [Nitrospirae bacterium]|nr:ATP-dependent DNA helicase RecG [Nitrospirota bacterium]
MTTKAEPERFSVQYLKGVGPSRARVLARLGIHTAKDILFYLPYRYEDRSSIRKIAHLKPDEANTISGRVLKTEIIRLRRGNIFEVIISDGSGILKAKWFNQLYLDKIFRPGQQVFFYGTVKCGYRGFEITHPEFEIISESLDEPTDADQIHIGRIVPIYGLTEGISQKVLRGILHSALNTILSDLQDPFPDELIKLYNLHDLQESLYNVHFPPPSASIEEMNRGVSIYHQRLIFGELFAFEAGLALMKKNELQKRGIAFNPDGSLTGKLKSGLPFKLTGAQEKVIDEILKDMTSHLPMRRLIQGDVGSGKTIVALIAMLSAVECGCQSALMAPTELLAEQHFINIQGLVERLGLRVHLLTSSTKGKGIGAVSLSDADIIIGTHAIIQEGVSFKNLGLVVIDEQHRFGVAQRAALSRKGANPDTIVMTATPIPRTLALTIYGDLDYSIIDELPPNRRQVITRLYSEGQKSHIYRLIEEETVKGRQIYIVYPVIEESEGADLKSAIIGADALQKKFQGLKVGLLHGRMKQQEREAVMAGFKSGDLDILVATTVIEVGVDVPNATVMVIIHAERFGLAQLHQLRGRVGRGGDQSYCILLSYRTTEDAKKRLAVMVGTTDGFRIAEEDLNIRGQGEFFGTKQSGMPDLKIANLARDIRILELARQAAFSMIELDPSLERNYHVKGFIKEFWGDRLDMFRAA